MTKQIRLYLDESIFGKLKQINSNPTVATARLLNNLCDYTVDIPQEQNKSVARITINNSLLNELSIKAALNDMSITTYISALITKQLGGIRHDANTSTK